MSFRFPIRLLLSLTVALGVVYAVYGADAPARNGSDDGHQMRVELRDGTTLEGKLTQPVRLKTDYGVDEINPSHIKSITFRPPGEDKAQDTIELTDKARLRGRIEGKDLRLETGNGSLTIPLANARQLKAVAERQTSFAAIALGLITLTAMEIVLGIDNVIFLAILAGKLPEPQQPKARRIGLMAALGTRLLLLATLSWLLGLTRPLFTLPDLPLLHSLEAREVSLRDLILLLGGLFLIGKSVMEVHEKLEHAKNSELAKPAPTTSFVKVILQIAVIDIVFSLDSVITAVGMVEDLWIMVTAMVAAMLVMLAFAGAISRFVGKHPTVKILALSFLILIGVMLVAEALGQHMDKGYIYFAMAFAVVIEMINLRLRKKPDDSPKGAP